MIVTHFFVIVMFFLSGLLLGHSQAKYARNKKESMAVAGVILLMTLIGFFIVSSPYKP